MDWGEVPGTTPLYGVLSASAGLFSALLVGAVVVLKDEGFFQSVLEFVHASVAATLGVSGVVAVLLIITLMVATIAGIALIGGTIIFHSSSSERSYIGYVWRGALVPLVGILLFLVSDNMQIYL